VEKRLGVIGSTQVNISLSTGYDGKEPFQHLVVIQDTVLNGPIKLSECVIHSKRLTLWNILVYIQSIQYILCVYVYIYIRARPIKDFEG